MDNAAYLEAAGRTEKTFPDGLAIPAKDFHELAATFADFIEIAHRVDVKKKEIIYKGLTAAPGEAIVNLSQQQAQSLHYLMGMVGEVGEIADALGANLTVDSVIHFLEELGDYRWYESGFYRLFNVTPEYVQELNIRKLMARYPEKYSDHLALNRDTKAEKAAMESQHDLLGR